MVKVVKGGRKRAIARVSMKKGSGKVTINNRLMENYFFSFVEKDKIFFPFHILGQDPKVWDLFVRVKGGGFTGQSDAIKHAISHYLYRLFKSGFIEISEENQKKMKEVKLLTRDPRKVESKKPGKVKARKKNQFSKR